MLYLSRPPKVARTPQVIMATLVTLITSIATDNYNCSSDVSVVRLAVIHSWRALRYLRRVFT